MSTECARIADQVRFAFSGDAWYGPNLRTSLTDVTAEQARARPLAAVHSIWELLLHIDLWADIAFRAAAFGIEMPKLYGTEKDWTTPFTGSEDEWAAAQAHLFETAERLAETIEAFPDERLGDIVPGREYNFYYLFHGVVQHSVYHAGQIALLKRS
jgi:uncharacterized damage-inducible protein DinB